MRAFGLLYAPRRCIFFLNYVDGKLTENDIAGLVCNGTFQPQPTLVEKFVCEIYDYRDIVFQFQGLNFRVRENRLMN